MNSCHRTQAASNDRFGVALPSVVIAGYSAIGGPLGHSQQSVQAFVGSLSAAQNGATSVSRTSGRILLARKYSISPSCPTRRRSFFLRIRCLSIFASASVCK